MMAKKNEMNFLPDFTEQCEAKLMDLFGVDAKLGKLDMRAEQMQRARICELHMRGNVDSLFGGYRKLACETSPAGEAERKGELG